MIDTVLYVFLAGIFGSILGISVCIGFALYLVNKEEE
jgi:hypothetical protein